MEKEELEGLEKRRREQMEKEELEGLEKRRREHFNLEVKPTRCEGEPGEVALAITHNGYQWTVINLTPIERLKVIRALIMTD